MKKLQLHVLAIVLLFISTNVFAQAPCVPGTITSPNAGYILPDSATNFVHGCAGMYYEQIIYIKVPKDTTLVGNTVAIDSFIVDANVLGLPAGLTVEGVPAIKPAVPSDPKRNFPHMRIKGDSLACVKISGTISAAAPAGNNMLTINMRAYGKIFIIVPLDTPASVGYYNIIIDAPGTGACLASNVKDISKSNLNSLSLIPNPSFGNTQLNVTAENNTTATLKIINNLGAILKEEKVKLNSGMNHLPIDTKSFATGNYIIQLIDEKGKTQTKLIVE